jgi:hypothetical protein
VIPLFASVDRLARVLSVIGATGGLIGTVVSVMTYRRDRAKLRITYEADSSLPYFSVWVVNDGRRPVALNKISVRDWGTPLRFRLWNMLGPLRFFIPVEPPSVEGFEINPKEEIPTHLVLDPGSPYQATFESRRIVDLAESGRGLWVVASDAMGRQKKR